MGAHGEQGTGGPHEENLSSGQVWMLRGAVLAVALLAAVIAWAATGDDDASPAAAEPAARVAGEEELVDASALLGQPIYWAGPVAATTIELEELEDGVRVKYVGEDGSETLTVASYPLPDPAGALRQFAAQSGTVAREAEDGTKVFYDKNAPNSVYFADPADPADGVQVEVYAPSPALALKTALSGSVEPVK
ncbi:MAG TPA: hypothetical protein VFU11_09730 [Solirubrobacterales bacterium]|nr:hypothetical protein [Solirubrobacterales bacterium]